MKSLSKHITESLNKIRIYESLNKIGIYESLRIGINDSPQEDIVLPFLKEFFDNMPESLDNEDNLTYFWPLNNTFIKTVEAELRGMLNNVINKLDNPLDNIVELTRKQLENPGYYILCGAFRKNISKKEDLLPERLYISDGENVYIIGMEYDWPTGKEKEMIDGLMCDLDETVQTIANGVDSVFFEDGYVKAVYINCDPELNEINKLFI